MDDGIGAFTAAILVVDHGWTIEATFPVAAILADELGQPVADRELAAQDDSPASTEAAELAALEASFAKEKEATILVEETRKKMEAAKTDEEKAKLSEADLASFDETKVDVSSCPPMYKSEGEALFNMGYEDGFAGGAYSCGRCHTKGWSYDDPQTPGGGALGRRGGGGGDLGDHGDDHRGVAG